jgi:hypothetical protein
LKERKEGRRKLMIIGCARDEKQILRKEGKEIKTRKAFRNGSKYDYPYHS